MTLVKSWLNLELAQEWHGSVGQPGLFGIDFMHPKRLEMLSKLLLAMLLRPDLSKIIDMPSLSSRVDL